MSMPPRWMRLADPSRTLLLLTLLGTTLAGCASQPDARPGATQRSGERNPERTRLAQSRALGLNSSGTGDAAIEDALHEYYQEWQGVPYRYGGRDESGIDCSSFVRQTLGSIEALALPRTAREQARRGHPVDRSELSPGDLVFFKTGRSARHVGVYVGNGRFMHASSSKGVTISRLDNIYWRSHYWQSRRVTTLAN